MSLILDESTMHTQIVFFIQPKPEMKANDVICCWTTETVMDSKAGGITGRAGFIKKW